MLKFFNANKKNSLKKLEEILNLRKNKQKIQTSKVKQIIFNVKKRGDTAVINYEKKFSNIKTNSKKLKFTKNEVNLISKKVEIAAYDPVAIENMRNLFPTVNYKNTMNEVIKNASAIVIMTDWNEFRALDLEKVGKIMKEKIIIDSRNLLSRDDLFNNEFIFEGVGRPFQKKYD